MIKKLAHNFFKGEKVSNSITKSAILIAVMGLASKILGLLRDRILAAKFGAGDVLDIYYASFKIPDLIYNLFILGALSAAFIPVFSSLLAREKEKEAWDLVNAIISIGSLLVLFLSFLFFVFADQLVGLVVFGYSEEKKQLAVGMTRVMLLSPFLLGISGILGGILNSYKKFFFYSLAPIFYNLGIILGATVLVDKMGVLGLAWGVVLGAFLHLFVQLPEVVRCGLKFRFNLDWRNKNLRKILALMIPRTLGIATAQLNLLIIVTIASTLTSGSLAIFNLANNLESVPLSLFGISFSIASFPVLAGLWGEGRKEEFGRRLLLTMRKILFFIIPASALVFVVRAQIVRVVLGAGKFDWQDTYLTFTALGIFALSLWAQGLIPLLARAFYAMHNTRIPFLAGLLAGVFNVVVAVWLAKTLGVLGLVWAFSLASVLNAILLFAWLKPKLVVRGVVSWKDFSWKLLLATLAMLTVAQLVKQLVGAEPFGSGYTFWGVLTQLLLSVVSGLVVFVLVAWLLKIEELKDLLEIFWRKIFIKKNFPEDINSQF